MTNALSVDVEDWFCVSNFSGVIRREDWGGCDLRVVANTRRILRLLAERRIEATFFVLGWIAERVPDLVREIEQGGHEIASHGYAHRMVTAMTPDEFDEDIQRSLHVLAACSASPIIGYRAPSFTITAKTSWALDVLLKRGFKYDSSVFPIGLHPDYGIADAPLSIHATRDGMMEVPLSCLEVFGRRIPCSGGGYFRLFPYVLSRLLCSRIVKEGRPLIFYLHPWEIDPLQPRVKLPIVKGFRHYNNLAKMYPRLERLLGDFSFTSIRKVLAL